MALILNVLGVVAQFERDLIVERTKAGLEAAKKRGKRLGPPLKWSPEMAKKARALMTKDGPMRMTLPECWACLGARCSVA